MSDSKSQPQPIELLVGEEVVVDMGPPFVAMGVLVEVRDDFLVLKGADLHDLRDTATTREKYILDSHEHGIRSNRRQVWVNRREVVAVSRLGDVVRD